MASSEIAENNTIVQNKEEDQQKELQTTAYAMELINISALPMVLLTAIDLEIFEIISKVEEGAKLTATEIAAEIPHRNPQAPAMLDRMLCHLAAFNIVRCTVDPDNIDRRLYGLAPVAKYFVKNEEGVSLGPLLGLVQDKVLIDSWYRLKDAVMDGGVAFDKVHGMHAFEYPGFDGRFNQVFNRAMMNHTTIVMKKILESYSGFEGLNKVVDVGGGLGITLKLITSKYPNIKGINFDLPHVIQEAPTYPQVEHVGGDMFDKVPEGDAIFMKWILHDWSDDHCVKLLNNCYNALPENGKMIVVEQILPVHLENNVGVRGVCGMDMAMMTQNPGGKERRQHEYLALAATAGFEGISFISCVFNFWVMEFFK
ncbi:O-methyltransferase domain [Dillenia turbinata]|uniref:O-methyltransferase domain n=1 Tax=Dillenia turbinata TaxID=194707 RepID=A0AAN8W7X8_9MAGN